MLIHGKNIRYRRRQCSVVGSSLSENEYRPAMSTNSGRPTLDEDDCSSTTASSLVLCVSEAKGVIRQSWTSNGLGNRKQGESKMNSVDRVRNREYTGHPGTRKGLRRWVLVRREERRG